jgi:hypothetical protein
LNKTETCQPWCGEHDDEGDCQTLWCLYRAEDYTDKPSSDPVPETTPEVAALARAFRADTGLPPEPDAVFLKAFYITETGKLEICLDFWDDRMGESLTTLSTNLRGLKNLHSELGRFIKEAETK